MTTGNAFVQTALTLAPVAAAFGAICYSAWGILRALDARATRRVDRMVDDGLAAIRAQDAADVAVLDTVQRWRRDQDANRIARHVRGAFLAQMQAESDEDAFDRAREQIRALPEVEG